MKQIFYSTMALLLALVIWAVGSIAVGQEDAELVASTTTSSSAVTTSTTTKNTTTTTTITVPILPPESEGVVEAYWEELASLTPPTVQEIACGWIATLPDDKYLGRVRGDYLATGDDICMTVAQARLDIHDIDNPDHLDVPKFEFERYRIDVLHMLYIGSLESGEAMNPLANGQNWGCPRQEELRGFHPDPEGVGPVTGKTNCKKFNNNVPTGSLSHMAQLFPARSYRILGYLINPYDLYEASLLGFGLVYEVGGNGWYHWWHISWTGNRYWSKYGVRAVWHCPKADYWKLVRGGQQACPVG